MSSAPYPPNVLNWRLEQVGRAVRETADQIYRQEYGIGIDQLRVLRIVSSFPDQSVNTVVKDSNFERSYVSRIVSFLAKQELLTRTISPDDARQFLLRTSAAGEKITQNANIFGEELNQDLLSIFAGDELEVFEICLKKLSQWQPKKKV